VMKENNQDTAGLTALLSYVKQMEDFANKAEGQISDMKSQISEMKEIQKHPIKTALQKASASLEAKATKMCTQIGIIHEKVVHGCKNALTAFKENGITALDKLASFFHIKQGLEFIKKEAVEGMVGTDKSIAVIERFSKEYHSASRAIKNMVRMMIGVDPKDTQKEMGILAKSMCVPYKAEKKYLEGINNVAIKAIAKLDELGMSASRIREQNQERKKPSFDTHLAAFEEKAKLINAERNSSTLTFKPKQQEEAVI